jgi:hypothetical protein
MKKSILALAVSLFLPLFVEAGSVESVHSANRYIQPYQPHKYIRPPGSQNHRYRQGPRRIMIEDRGYDDYARREYPRRYRRPIRPMVRPYEDVRCESRSPLFGAGDVITYLPYGARPVVVEHRRYYYHDGYYFQPRLRGAMRVYLVLEL